MWGSAVRALRVMLSRACLERHPGFVSEGALFVAGVHVVRRSAHFQHCVVDTSRYVGRF